MLTQEQINKLNAYFGFASKKRAIYVGIRLEEALAKNKVSLLLIGKECSLKNEEKLISSSVDKRLLILRYEGEYNIALAAGYEKLKALGISDRGLAKAIYEILQADEIKEEK